MMRERRLTFEQFNTGYEEADYIARDIAGGVRNGDYHYGDYAVLYRTNAQSRLFEEKFYCMQTFHIRSLAV